MSRPQQVAWFRTRQAAQALERRLRAKAIANGQQCEQWAQIIEDATEGFGVPVKDRVLGDLNDAERRNMKQWIPPQVTDIPGLK